MNSSIIEHIEQCKKETPPNFDKLLKDYMRNFSILMIQSNKDIDETRDKKFFFAFKNIYVKFNRVFKTTQKIQVYVNVPLTSDTITDNITKISYKLSRDADYTNSLNIDIGVPVYITDEFLYFLPHTLFRVSTYSIKNITGRIEKIKKIERYFVNLPPGNKLFSYCVDYYYKYCIWSKKNKRSATRLNFKKFIETIDKHKFKCLYNKPPGWETSPYSSRP